MAEELTDEVQQQHLRRLVRQERAGDRTVITIPPHTVVVLSYVVRWICRCGPGPLIEWGPGVFAAVAGELDALLAGDPDGAALRRRRELVTLPVGPYTAVMLLGAIRPWLRHLPDPEPGAALLDPAIEQLVAMLAEEPVVLRMAREMLTAS